MKPDAEDRLALAFEKLVENQPVPEMGYAHPRFQQSLQDRGYFREFAHPVYQNGKTAPATCLPQALIDKTNALRPGKYLGGHVTVAHDAKGGIHLLYKTATADDRMKNMTLFLSFEDLIDKITAEASLASPA